MTFAESSGAFPESVVAIGWGYHRRLDGLCRELGVRYVSMKTTRTGLRRWLELTVRTTRVLLSERPRTVIAQSPSLVLALLCVLLSRPMRFQIVIDAHNEAVQPYIHTGWIVRAISRWLLKAADVTLVTNAALAEIVERRGGHPLVLHDPIPIPPIEIEASTPPDARSPDVVVISTYAPDEPFGEIMEAAASLEGQATFAVTGRVPSGFFACPPPNVRLTDFLSERDYWTLLRQASIVVDLTRMPNCLVCGAYEALALGKPMVLTEDAASRDLFGDSVIAVRNEAPEIARAILESMAMRAAFGERVRQRRVHVGELWKRRADEFVTLVNTNSRRLSR